ncbi:MAG TPA: 2-aminoethylphosphonate aminotransferase [Blastocatellia bacterium]|nr:2-aminoethylphosphonate aminotransferase [Blastocatellia bacterium]
MNSSQNRLAPKLLNPGPVTLTARVRAALIGIDLCHREPEFAALQTVIRARLINVYPAAAQDFTALLIAGSGTAAVEAMVGSFVPRQGHALVVANGVYGERMAAMLTAQGKTAHIARAAWTEPMNLAAAEQMLMTEPRITHVLAVQHETTTGRLNDLAALGALCRRFDKPLLLDAVSSFGAEEIDFEYWNLAACAATANKCLHGVPGVSFVLARRDAMAAESGATSLYLDLFRYFAEQEKGSTPFTMPVQVCYALAEALRELEDAGGWQARRTHYAALSQQVFAGLQAQGIAPLLDLAAPSSSVLTSYRVPAGMNYTSLHAALKTAGFVIYAGQGQFQDEIFRIAVMGDLNAADIERLLAAFAQWRQQHSAQARGGGG